MPIQPTTLNHRLTTPNKLFEAMAAGVAGRRVAICRGWPASSARPAAGLLVDPTDPAAIAAALRAILDARRRPSERRSRRRGLAAAHETYNWEVQIAPAAGRVRTADGPAVVSDLRAAGRHRPAPSPRRGPRRKPGGAVFARRSGSRGRLAAAGYSVEIAATTGARPAGARGRRRLGPPSPAAARDLGSSGSGRRCGDARARRRRRRAGERRDDR